MKVFFLWGGGVKGKKVGKQVYRGKTKRSFEIRFETF